jgi:hypothetical protein
VPATNWNGVERMADPPRAFSSKESAHAGARPSNAADVFGSATVRWDRSCGDKDRTKVSETGRLTARKKSLSHELKHGELGFVFLPRLAHRLCAVALVA